MARDETVAIEDAGDDIILGDQHELTHSSDDVAGSAVALAAPAPWQAHLAVHAADPVDDQDDLSSVLVDVGDHLVDEGAHDALLQPRVCGGRRPDRLQVHRERGERSRVCTWHRPRRLVGDNLGLRVGDLGKRSVPTRFELARHETISGIRCVILTEGAIGCVVRSFKVAPKRVAHLVPPLARALFGGHGGGDGAGANHIEQRVLNSVIDTQTAEGDAARLATIEPPAIATVARNSVLCPVYRTISLRPQR